MEADLGVALSFKSMDLILVFEAGVSDRNDLANSMLDLLSTESKEDGTLC
jgi:hypothetical protein